MLLQLENPDQKDVNKLLEFAAINNLNLSLVDDRDNNNFLPGKPLTHEQLTELIQSSRRSGMMSMHNAHELIRNNFNAG